MPKATAAAKRLSLKPSSRVVETDFPGAFAALREILARHAPKLKVVRDTPKAYYLDTNLIRKKDKKPMFFGAAVINKNYVSFHLMPVYCSPELQKKISPQLKKRMQGKACFNFTAPDPALVAELDALTSTSLEPYLEFLRNMP
jgi:hypothetical protein